MPDNTQPNHSVESIPRSKSRKKRRTANDTDTKPARSFHVTLRLRAEHIAKLWVRRATPHNVAVWSSETKQWVPLLAVSTLRDAIAQAYEVEARQEDSTDTQVIRKPTSLAPESAARGTPAAPEAALADADRLAASAPRVPTLHSEAPPRHELPPPAHPDRAELAAPLGAPLHQSLPKSLAPPADLLKPRSLPPPPATNCSVPRTTLVPPPMREALPAPRLASVPPPEMGRRHRGGKRETFEPPVREALRFELPVREPLPGPKLPSTIAPAPRAPARGAGAMSSFPPVALSRAPSTPPAAPQRPAVPEAAVPVRAAAAAALAPAAPASVVRATVPRSQTSPREGSFLGNFERVIWMVAGICVTLAVVIGASNQLPGLFSRSNPAPAAAARAPSMVAQSSSEPVGLPRATDNQHKSQPKAEAKRQATSEPKTAPKAEPKSEPMAPPAPPPVHAALAANAEGLVRAEDLPEASSLDQRPHEPSGGASQSRVSHSQQAAASKSKGATRFDVGFARRVLASAVARASRCADQATRGVALVTFAPTGFVNGVSLAGFQGQGDRRGCISRAFREARLPPFEGEAVTVKRSFNIP